jgi:hypothetical protein
VNHHKTTVKFFNKLLAGKIKPRYYFVLGNVGAIAQLGERLHGMQEVSGSIPLGSTKFRP